MTRGEKNSGWSWISRVSLCVSWILLGICISPDFVEAREYYGKAVGPITTYAHKVSGKVFAVDEDTLFIKDFTYDGLGPDAYFWIGTTQEPSPTGTLVPYPDEYSEREPPVLRDFNKEDVIIHLPPGYKVKDIAWLSVWCRRFTVNFGDVKIPKNLQIPKRRVLPEFKRLAHGLRSGNITILDSRTFYIPNLYYDGAGPDAFFWVGTGNEPHPGGRKIPNEKGSLEVLRGYQGEDIEIQLPQDISVYDIDWLAVWCIRYKHNFGHVFIPKTLDVPPSLDKFKTAPTQRPAKRPADSYTNCRDLLDRSVQLQWERDGDSIKFKLSGRITDKQWVALGFSPEIGRTQMVGADAVVVYYTPRQREQFHAVDYFMSSKSQCDGVNGVCPDKRIGGSNDVRVISGSRKNGVTTVVFTRPIKASESSLDASLEDEVNIFVAIGNLNNRNESNYHFGQRTNPEAHKTKYHHHHHPPVSINFHNDKHTDLRDDIRINPKGRGDHSCMTILDEEKPAVSSGPKPWPVNKIEGVTNFTARIGPTGGKRGYTQITGNPSWGIAWYINDQLIPEISVERGKTYQFWIEGGNDPKNPARYHPFYITDSIEGGYGQKSEYEQNQQKVYAGVARDSAGYPYATAAGRYCEWEHKTIDKSSQSETFQDFMKTLNLVCDDGRPSLLTWTVPDDAPNLLYYQCYTHNNLGWKIHVLNEGESAHSTQVSLLSSSSKMCATLSVILLSSFLVIIAAISN